MNEAAATANRMGRSTSVLVSMMPNAPIAVRLVLKAVNRGLESTQTEGCELEAALFGLCATTGDRTEETTAFLGKRKPAFRGK